MKRLPVLTITLNPAVDKTARLPAFRAGHDHRIGTPHLSAGGKGINVSRALRHLGVASRASGFLGGPEGAFIRQRLAREKIPADFVTVGGMTRTSWTIIDEGAGRITRLLEDGPAVGAAGRRRFRARFRRLLRGADVVVLSGRSIPGAGDGFYAELVRMARRLGKRAVLDTSGAPLRAGVAARPDLIKPNLAEAQFVLGRRLRSLSSLKDAALRLRRRGVATVVISLGARGALAAQADECLLAVPPRVRPVSTVGCGDALIAGFVAGGLAGDAFEPCLRRGVAAGTVNAMSIHPGEISRGRVREMMKRIAVRRL